MRAQWHWQELFSWEISSRPGRYRQRYEGRHGGGHLQRRSQVQQGTQAVSRAYRREMRLERGRRATEGDHPRELATRRVFGRIVQRPAWH